VVPSVSSKLCTLRCGSDEAETEADAVADGAAEVVARSDVSGVTAAAEAGGAALRSAELKRESAETGAPPETVVGLGRAVLLVVVSVVCSALFVLIEGREAAAKAEGRVGVAAAEAKGAAPAPAPASLVRRCSDGEGAALLDITRL
jgi:hypothetical protein